MIVGDGPARAALERRYPHAHFLGSRHGEALAEVYASADVFVFPSRTDTFGIVLIEAMASGLPVAAFPVPGPIDVVGPGAGVLDEDLRAACLKALTIPREDARAYSMRFTWRESARQFLDNIEVQPPEFPGSGREARTGRRPVSRRAGGRLIHAMIRLFLLIACLAPAVALAEDSARR